MPKPYLEHSFEGESYFEVNKVVLHLHAARKQKICYSQNKNKLPSKIQKLKAQTLYSL